MTHRLFLAGVATVAMSITGSAVSGCGNLVGCIEGSNEVASETRIPTGENPGQVFTGIKLDGSVDVIVTQGPYEVRVEGDNNLLAMVKTTVTGKTLVVDNEGCYVSQHPLIVHVSLPNLESISTNGSGDVTGTSRMTASALSLSTNGSGDVALEIDATNLTVSSNGSGDVLLHGRAVNSNVNMNGSGDFSALELLTDRTMYMSSGSGDGEISVSNELHAQLSGSGDLGYRGTPGIFDVNESGSGDIRRIP